MKDEFFELRVETGGTRLDKFLATRLERFSRAALQRLIAEGKVRVNDQTRAASYKIRAGELIRIRVSPPEPSAARAEPIPLNILYEDDDLIVINKPAGLVVHPAAGHAGGTLVNALLHHAPQIAIGGAQRPGIVHRLDRDTSGVIVIAKNEASLKNLQAQFKTRTVRKVYLALVRGKITNARGRIEAAIGRDPRHRQKMAVVANSAKRAREAETEFVVRVALNNYSLLELYPKTGRTHQLRVHLAFIGHPIVGDPVYGRTSDHFNISRQLLHAWKISFDHPRTAARQNFTAPLPNDFIQALETLGVEPKQFAS